MQFECAIDTRADLRVVPGADGVEPEVEPLLEHSRKLNVLIAPHARVRCATSAVFGDEVVDHVEAEAL